MAITVHWLAISVSILGWLNVVSAQFPYIGECPNITVQEDFDMSKYMGTWYEMERTMSFLEFAAKCVSVTFNSMPYNDSSIEVLNEGKGPILGLRKKVRLMATVPDPEEPAKMELRLTDLSLHGKYWVLKTDYTNYAIVWSCNHIWLTFKKTHTENLWILSRKREIDPATRDSIKKFLNENNIRSRKLLRSVNQKNCD